LPSARWLSARRFYFSKATPITIDSDNPFKREQPCVFEAPAGVGTVDCNSIPASSTFTPDAWTNHPIVDVPNIHRIVVHGSTTPLEWIRLTVAPGPNARRAPARSGRSAGTV